MMSDLTVSEKRLLAALKRIDVVIERGASQADGQTGVEQAHQRLAEAEQDIAQLAAANDVLTKANRQLLERLETGGDGADDVRVALEAELAALHAARAAEEAQVMGILERLDQVADHLAHDGAGAAGKPSDKRG